MAIQKIKPTDATKAYISKIDNLANNLLQNWMLNRQFVRNYFGEEFEANQDTLRTGCRVWVRYLNDVDLDVDTNIKFVEQKQDNPNGIDGLKFWKLLSTPNNITGITPTTNNGINFTPYLANLVPGGTALMQIVGIVGSDAGGDINRRDAIVKSVTDLLACFSEFTKDYQTELSKQFPDLAISQNGGSNNGGTGGSGSGSNNGTAGNLPNNSAFFGIDFKNPLTWLVIVVIVFGIKKLFFSQNNNFVPA